MVELINALLREANASNDFLHPRIIIPALFAFHKIEHGAEDFVYVSWGFIVFIYLG
jgi:hypothetical protein